MTPLTDDPPDTKRIILEHICEIESGRIPKFSPEQLRKLVMYGRYKEAMNKLYGPIADKWR